MYDARIHPEQYSNTLSATQIKQLHKSIHYICSFAVDNLADSSKFPEEWLFKHRWGKGKKDSTTTLPNGSKFVYLTVGGRTSCVVPSVQKKTGPVAKDVKSGSSVEEEESAEEKPKKPKKGQKGSKIKEDNVEEDEKEENPTVKKAAPKKRTMEAEKEDPTINGQSASDDKSVPSAKKKRKKNAQSEANEIPAANNGVSNAESGRRRSARVSGKGV